jgi:hypothetical protein
MLEAIAAFWLVVRLGRMVFDKYQSMQFLCR